MKKVNAALLEKQKLSNDALEIILGGGIYTVWSTEKLSSGYKINGPSCGCACAYANNGGSSTADNRSANDARGLHSR